MKNSSISPIRSSKTPLARSSLEKIPVIQMKRIKYESLRVQEIKTIKEEIRNNKDFVKKQKENEMKTAREKIKNQKENKIIAKVKKLQSSVKLGKSLSASKNVMKNNLKSHLEWVQELDKKVRGM